MIIKQTDFACGPDIDAAEAFASIVLPEGDHIDEDEFRRGIPGPREWSEIAHLSMCNRRGGAQSLTVSGKGGVALEADGTILLRGQGGYDGESMSIGVRFTVPAAGRYSAAVRLKRQTPNWSGDCAFGLNGLDLGAITISPEPKVYTFMFELGAGEHGFSIRELGINVYFYGLTIFTTPILHP